jgi:hypothetical protein
MVIQGITTGEDFERAMLGISHSTARHAVPRLFGTRDFETCVEHVKENQQYLGWNPRKPKTLLSKRIYTCVASGLKELPKKDLRLFISVGTPLDEKYGVDCFFEFQGAIVTIDLTISERKQDPRADVVLTLADLNFDLHYALSWRISHLLSKRFRAIA